MLHVSCLCPSLFSAENGADMKKAIWAPGQTGLLICHLKIKPKLFLVCVIFFSSGELLHCQEKALLPSSLRGTSGVQEGILQQLSSLKTGGSVLSLPPTQNYSYLLPQ